MKDNILVGILLVVGLLTPVFAWLFYCWFKSHLTSQHHEGQVFHRRFRDRADANWRLENGNARSVAMGPHFTDRGWVRPKPYGETRVLPLSQDQKIVPNPQESPLPQDQEPNPLSKRQQKKLRAEQRRKSQQQQQHIHQPSQQNEQNQKSQKKQKNKNKNRNKRHNQDQKQGQEHQNYVWQSNNGEHTDGQEEADINAALPHYTYGENSQHEKDVRSTGWAGWGDDSAKHKSLEKSDAGGRQKSPARSYHNNSPGYDNHHQKNQSKQNSSRHGSQRRGSQKKSNNGARGHNGSLQRHNSPKDDYKGWRERSPSTKGHHSDQKKYSSSTDNRNDNSEWDGNNNKYNGGWEDDNQNDKDEWGKDTRATNWDDDKPNYGGWGNDNMDNNSWGGNKHDRKWGNDNNDTNFWDNGDNGSQTSKNRWNDDEHKEHQSSSNYDTNKNGGARSWSRESRVHRDKRGRPHNRDGQRNSRTPSHHDHREKSPENDRNSNKEGTWGRQAADKW